MAEIQRTDPPPPSRFTQPWQRAGAGLRYCGWALALGALLAVSVYLVVRLEVDLREPLKFAAAALTLPA